MRARVAIAASLLVAFAGLAIALTTQRPERTGVNGIPPATYVESLRHGEVACQPATIPAGTTAIGVTVGTYGVPGPPVSVSLPDAPGLGGHASGGYAGGELHLPVGPVRREVASSVCIRNEGAGRLALAGARGAPGASTLDGRGSPAVLQMAYLRGSASAFGLAPLVARRIGLLDFGGTGSWLLWAVVLLMVLASAGAIALIVRELGDEKR